MVRLCSQQNRLVPGQCLSVRTAPILGPVTKSVQRITGAGRRPGTPPANAGLGRRPRHACGPDPFRCVEKSTDQVAEPTGPARELGDAQRPRRGAEKDLELDVVAAMASTRCRVASTPSTRPSESARASPEGRGGVATESIPHRRTCATI